jgi:hypothetical protein
MPRKIPNQKRGQLTRYIADSPNYHLLVSLPKNKMILLHLLNIVLNNQRKTISLKKTIKGISTLKNLNENPKLNKLPMKTSSNFLKDRI